MNSAPMRLVLISLLILMLQPAFAETWPVFRGGLSNSKIVPVRAKAHGNFTSFESHGIVWGTPVLDAEGNAYVGSADKHFYKFSPQGKLLWAYALFDRADSLVDSAAALTTDGKVIVPGGDGFLHALDQKTGKRLWTFRSSGVSDSEHSAGKVVNSFEGNVQIGPNGWIYAGSDNGTMFAVDPTGQERWSFKTGMMIWSSPCFDSNNRWMAFGSLDGKLYLLDPVSGAKLDAWDAGSEVKSSPATDGLGALYFGTSSGDFVKLSVRTGFHLKKEWSLRYSGEIYSSPTFAEGVLYFGSLNGSFYAVSEQGKQLWEYQAHSPISASPLVTSEKHVYFGAKNGKLYALNADNGQRDWSIQLSTHTLKSNLDSSPVLRQDGTIICGSYSGKIFFLPLDYCENAKMACERGGSQDIVEAHPTDSGVIRIVEDDGSLVARRSARVAPFEVVQLRLMGFAGGRLLDHAAMNALETHVEISPDIPIETTISSDGSTIDLRAPGGFAPGTRYEIRARGNYYESTNWISDRFKWIGLREFTGQVEFVTLSPKDEPIPSIWGIQSLFLVQPKALDTYIPAALDSQAFLVSVVATDPLSGKMILLSQPALPSADGAPKPLLDVSNTFLMTGMKKEGGFIATGSMTISAMGGSTRFRQAIFSGVLNERGDLENGQFFTASSCFDIQGNGASYQFPLGLVSQICDYRFRMITLGTYQGRRIQPQPSGARLEDRREAPTGPTGNDVLEATISSSDGKPHLVSAVVYDPKTMLPTAYGAVVVQGGGPVSLPLRKTDHTISLRQQTRWFIDQIPQ